MTAKLFLMTAEEQMVFSERSEKRGKQSNNLSDDCFFSPLSVM